MTKNQEHAEAQSGNVIPVIEDQLKDDQRAALERAMEEYKIMCLRLAKPEVAKLSRNKPSLRHVRLLSTRIQERCRTWWMRQFTGR